MADCCLEFDSYLLQVARISSQKQILLKRMKQLLDSDGLMTLYKVLVRPVIKYISFTWMSTARCHLNLLDKIQRRPKSFLGSIHYQPAHQEQRQEINQARKEQATPLNSLKHHRKVAPLTLISKTQIVQVTQLTDLGVTWKRSIPSARTVLCNTSTLEIPRSRSSTRQQNFSPATVTW